jgi:hypothetical protein
VENPSGGGLVWRSGSLIRPRLGHNAVAFLIAPGSAYVAAMIEMTAMLKNSCAKGYLPRPTEACEMLAGTWPGIA